MSLLASCPTADSPPLVFVLQEEVTSATVLARLLTSTDFQLDSRCWWEEPYWSPEVSPVLLRRGSRTRTRTPGPWFQLLENYLATTRVAARPLVSLAATQALCVKKTEVIHLHHDKLGWSWDWWNLSSLRRRKQEGGSRRGTQLPPSPSPSSSKCCWFVGQKLHKAEDKDPEVTAPKELFCFLL